MLEPGDTVIIGIDGIFSKRIVEIAGRLGAEVVPVEAEWTARGNDDSYRRSTRTRTPG